MIELDFTEKQWDLMKHFDAFFNRIGFETDTKFERNTEIQNEYIYNHNFDFNINGYFFKSDINNQCTYKSIGIKHKIAQERVRQLIKRYLRRQNQLDSRYFQRVNMLSKIDPSLKQIKIPERYCY